MTPFLYRIAQAFYKKYGNEISRLAFVFPNRRSGIFFQKYLAEVSGKPIFSPKVTTINDLMAELSPYTLIDRISLLVTLYKKYIELRKRKSSKRQPRRSRRRMICSRARIRHTRSQRNPRRPVLIG